jgi:hypothetical protein
MAVTGVSRALTKHTREKSMKTIKNVKVSTTKTATKVSTTKTRAAVRPSRKKSPAPVETPVATLPQPAPEPALASLNRPQPAPRPEITTELIAARAYALWEQQGRPHGRDLANWLLAESQLQQEIQSLAE